MQAFSDKKMWFFRALSRERDFTGKNFTFIFYDFDPVSIISKRAWNMKQRSEEFRPRRINVN